MPVKSVRDFKMPEYYDQTATGTTNRLKSMVTGARAMPAPGRPNLWALDQMHIENYELDGRTNLTATAPTCLFDVPTRSVSSTGRIEITAMNGQLLLDGQGFFLEVTNTQFIISNHVRAVIRQALLDHYKP